MNKGWTWLLSAMEKMMGSEVGNEGNYPVDASYCHEFADKIIHDPNWVYLGHWFPGAYRHEVDSYRYFFGHSGF